MKMPMSRPNPVRTSGTKVVSYENRSGVTYYLHEGKTKTGKPRYFFAKTIGEGALCKIPDDFEVSESINAVVSLRRKVPGTAVVPAADVRTVEAALGRHPHLSGYVVRVVGRAIVVFEPHPRPDELLRLVGRSGLGLRADAFVKDRMKHAKYDPIMKFEPEAAGYTVFRMTYRGKGGWSWPLQSGRLPDLADAFVRTIGIEAFFDLM